MANAALKKDFTDMPVHTACRPSNPETRSVLIGRIGGSRCSNDIAADIAYDDDVVVF